MSVGLDPSCQELRELTPALVEDPERGVPRAGKLACRLEHPIEHRVEVQLSSLIRRPSIAPGQAKSRPLLRAALMIVAASPPSLRATSLEELAERGRVVPELDDAAVRAVLASRLIYRLDDETVHVFELVHARAISTPWVVVVEL